jgi:hypothetical protein
MGYYVTLQGADFTIPDTPAVLAALIALDKRDDLKGGGMLGGDGGEERWFAWMNLPWTHHESVNQIFEQLGFDTHHYKDGDEEFPKVELLNYDCKAGDEKIFLAAVAPFVRPGSFVEWRGEDGAMWRHYVGIDHKLYVQNAEIKWTNAKEIKV